MPFGIQKLLPCLALLGAVTIAFVAPACSRASDDDDDAETVESRKDPSRAQNPPFLLNDDLVAQTVAALTDLRTAYEKQVDPTQQRTELRTMGAGIAFSVPRGAEIVRVHGFRSVEDFEQALRHVQLALSVVVMRDLFQGSDRDYDGGVLRFNLDNGIQNLKRERASTERDQSLSVDARREKVAQIDRDVEQLQQRIEELDSISSNFGSSNKDVPEQNVECVRKVKDTLMPVLIPSQH